MNLIALEDQFGMIRRKLWQARYLLEIVNDCGPFSDDSPEEKRRYFLFIDLLADVLKSACESADSFEPALDELGGQSLRPGSSATTAEPSTNSAPSAPVSPMCSRSSSAESNTATTGSM